MYLRLIGHAVDRAMSSLVRLRADRNRLGGGAMASSEFGWQLLPTPLLRSLKRELGLDGDPAVALAEWYGEVPGEDFVKDAWPVLRDRWLGRTRPARQTVVDALRSRRVGDLSIAVRSAAGQMEYLRSCRNSTGLRTTVLETFLHDVSRNGEGAADGTSAEALSRPHRRTANDTGETAEPSTAPWASYTAYLAGALRALSANQFLISTCTTDPASSSSPQMGPRACGQS